MQIAYIALVVLYVFICFFLILVVLLQQGKGADIAGAFGGGGTQTAFGARGATTLLHKLTVGSFLVFILTTLLIGLDATRRSGGTLMEGAETEQSAPAAPAQPAPAKPAAPAGQQQPAPAER